MTETDIIHNIKNGDTDAFKLLVDKHQSMVFRTVMGFVHVKEDAEDLTQEIFITVFQSLDYFQGKAEFATWLYRIAVNISLNYVKKNRIRKLFNFAEEKLQPIFNQQDKCVNPEEQIIRSEIEDLIRKAIDQLTEKQRTAFILSKYNELPQKKIASIMQISEGAVEQHLQRAKIKLQKKLSGLVGK
ncbi:MAG: RNA polymerase sigma factor [Paludibacter sp.]|nr:RNA polymerase sigma factor [Paludibacter sp.]MDD4199612.1 RNA polymerase sigma factor [Paludibacter sp.]MDD4428520.1 RNA polymerase sigma factor [Paludibacter sp.]